MSLNVNGTEVKNVVYNGVTLDKVIYNGVEVYSRSDWFDVASVNNNGEITNWNSDNQFEDIIVSGIVSGKRTRLKNYCLKLSFNIDAVYRVGGGSIEAVAAGNAFYIDTISYLGTYPNDWLEIYFYDENVFNNTGNLVQIGYILFKIAQPTENNKLPYCVYNTIDSFNIQVTGIKGTIQQYEE